MIFSQMLGSGSHFVVLSAATPTRRLRSGLSTLRRLLLTCKHITVKFSNNISDDFLTTMYTHVVPAGALLIRLAAPLVNAPRRTSFRRSISKRTGRKPRFGLPILGLSISRLRLPRMTYGSTGHYCRYGRTNFATVIGRTGSLNFPAIVSNDGTDSHNSCHPNVHTTRRLNMHSPLVRINFAGSRRHRLLHT